MSTENNLDSLYENSIKILSDLIAFKTVSGEDNNSLINYCDNILKKLGATSFKIFDSDKKRVNLFATLKAKKPNGKVPIILSGHTDVVPVSKGWSSDPFIATIKDDKLYGRGSCDMKGFIACVLAFAPIFSKSNLDRDINFSFTFDEETACIGAPLLIEELKKRGFNKGICIVGEPTNMKIIDAHKGCYEYTTYFEGLAGHSSAPHKGVSAVEFATRYASKLIELREELKKRVPKNSIFDPPFSTLQVGGIFGGIAHNVIADKCHINWETRPVVKEDGIFLNNEISIEEENNMYSILEKTILLKSVNLFQNIPGNVLSKIAQISSEIQLEEKDIIFREGDSGNSLFVIISGKVDIIKNNQIIANLEQGNCIGEMSLLDQEPRSADAISNGETILLKIDQDGFFELMSGSSEIMKQIVKMLTKRLRQTNKKLTDFPK